MNIVGDVVGKNCLIVDDMCDTGGTICKVAKALHEAGANEVYACFTHAFCRVARSKYFDTRI
jgi:ribose-phosphate pyrophosphokinase